MLHIWQPRNLSDFSFTVMLSGFNLRALEEAKVEGRQRHGGELEGQRMAAKMKAKTERGRETLTDRDSLTERQLQTYQDRKTDKKIKEE